MVRRVRRAVHQGKHILLAASWGVWSLPTVLTTVLPTFLRTVLLTVLRTVLPTVLRTVLPDVLPIVLAAVSNGALEFLWKNVFMSRLVYY